MDHSKFEDLEKGLKGNTIVDKLTNDFKILSQFRTIKSCLPPISYASYVELEVLIKEMVDYDIPSKSQWKEVERLGRFLEAGQIRKKGYFGKKEMHEESNNLKEENPRAWMEELTTLGLGFL